ncbi:MAG: hypothetical protein ACI87Q_002593, partial [Pseudohongiellaceae bacterium]
YKFGCRSSMQSCIIDYFDFGFQHGYGPILSISRLSISR